MRSMMRMGAHHRPAAWPFLALVLAFASLIPRATATELAAEPAAIEAVMLRSLARYVTWPPEAFVDEKAPWRICVLGKDPFGEILERSLKGRSEQGRSFTLHHPASFAELPTCQIAFLALGNSDRRRDALAFAKGKPVLTVSAESDFLEEGGIIRFRETDRVEMGVNLDQARAASLKIQSKMLEVAFEVLDNGKVRKLR
jgi:hypothetical protein